MVNYEETLPGYLEGQKGYHQLYKPVDGKEVKHLLRPDESVAGVYDDITGKLYPLPTDYELRMFAVDCGRGLPSLLSDQDLTNPGSINHLNRRNPLGSY